MTNYLTTTLRSKYCITQTHDHNYHILANHFKTISMQCHSVTNADANFKI